MSVRLCVFLCLAVGLGSKAEVTVKNSAYHNLLISFSPNVLAENGKSLMNSFKELLQETSEVLHTAIGLRIASVSFHIPATWDTSKWENVTVVAATASQRDVPSDVLVDATEDSAFGKDPFSLQYGGCGVPGQQITVPVDFLNRQEDYPKGKLLAREWLKYRYGVFDENGFENDALYPTHYQIPGTTDVIITECTDPEVEYYFKDPGDIHPKEGSAANVTSSLMYFHKELPNVKHVCGKDEHAHKKFTPSKHNVLCDGKSIWDILKRSSDFESTGEPSADAGEIQFSYVQETKPRIVIAVENSKKLADKIDSILFGVRRFLYDLPGGSEFALYSFDTVPAEEFPFTVLTSEASRDLTISADFASNGTVCTTCALTTAVDVLLNDNSQVQGSVILIVGSSSSEINDEFLQKLKTSQLCVTVIAFSGEVSIVDSFKTIVESSACGSKLELSLADEKNTAFKKLFQAMELSVPQIPANTKTITVNVETFSKANPLNISADPTADKFTLWLERNVGIEDIVCTAGDSSVTLIQEIKSEKIASYTFDATDSDVTCSLKFDRNDLVFTQVRMTTKAVEYFEDSLWFYDTTLESDTSQMPVIIYAKINFGKYPIRDANVIAIVDGPNGSKGDVVLLYDNGFGDPDITRNDGIYSRYYLVFPEVGEYTVTITAIDNGIATIGKNGANRCCGSEVNSSTSPVPSFLRFYKGTFEVKKKKPEDGYKPLRIIDLRVEKFEPPNSITLKWAAPGGEFDQDRAERYTIKSFATREDAVGNFNSSGSSLNATFFPNYYRNVESFKIPLASFKENATHYIAMRATNLNYQESDTSNVVEFFLPKDTGMIDPKTRDVIDIKIIGIIVGVVVLVIVVAIIVCLVTRRRAKLPKYV